MNTTSLQHGLAERSIQKLIHALESIADGELALERLVACGTQAIPYLELHLLDSSPRSIALARCRTVRALGALGAYSTLLAYFGRYKRPDDAVVLFAEDTVRSAAARELMHCNSEIVYRALLEAAKKRATAGLVQSLGEFRRPESVPLLFELLEDDLCRGDAMAELRKAPDAAQPYAILLLRGCTDTPIDGSSSSRRRRSVLQLLNEFGLSEKDWPEIQAYLRDQDLDCVIAASQLGFQCAPEGTGAEILKVLIRASAKMNWAQELEVTELLDKHSALARIVLHDIAMRRIQEDARPNWRSPDWRILYHVLGSDLQSFR
jgi:hypothetical protein